MWPKPPGPRAPLTDKTATTTQISEAPQGREDSSDQDIGQQISSLANQIDAFLIEETAVPLRIETRDAGLANLLDAVERLRQQHFKLIHQNETQTIGEGQLELKRRAEMRDVAKRFDETVGRVIRVLIKRGDDGNQATRNAVESFAAVVDAAADIRKTISDVKDSVSASEDSVDRASERADEALRITSEVSNAAQEIVKLVDLIEEIAFKTNMLAINASIEAARAGTAGKGFSVVAQEVKSLSKNTSEAALRVKKTALDMSRAAGNMTLAVETNKSANSEVSHQAQQVARAIDAQAASTARINECAHATNSEMERVQDGILSIQTQARDLTKETTDFVSRVTAEPGVTDQAVVFGQSAPFSGALKSFGDALRNGIELAFAEAEAHGGVHGRRPVLRAMDDGYDPDRALGNIRELVRGGEVFALAGAVGTPTSKLSERIARGGQVPFVGPATGTAFLRSPERAHVLNIRASYADEINILVRHLAARRDLCNCALFFQADAFGTSVRTALETALARHSGKITVLAPYDRASEDVSQAVARVQAAKPDVIFMAAISNPAATFVQALKTSGSNAAFATISFVNGTEFAKQAGPAGGGVLVSQVVPIPTDPGASKLVQIYRTAIERLAPDTVPDFAHLEGYIIGRTACHFLQKAGPRPTRENFLAGAFSKTSTFAIGDFQLQFGPGQNHGSSAVYLSQLREDGPFSLASQTARDVA